MVRVNYKFGDNYIHEEVIEPNFLLTNNFGGFFLDFKKTKYRGLHTLHQSPDGFKIIKSLDTIGITMVPTEVTINDFGFQKIYGKAKETFMTYENGLLYEIDNFQGASIMTLDCRELYSYETEGNKYDIYVENGFIIIEFTRKQGNKIATKHYVIIFTESKHANIKQWKAKRFENDEKRKNPPFEWFVFEALKFKVDKHAKMAIVSSEDKTRGMGEANYLFYNSERIKNQKSDVTKDLFSIKKKATKMINAANFYAKKTLNQLTVKSKLYDGIYAGLPWFCQFWTRDEAISLGAHIHLGDYTTAKKILFRHLEQLLDDGRLANRYPHSDLGSADGVGFVFLRARELFDKNAFTNEELIILKDKLKTSLQRLEQTYMKSGLIFSKPHETWMDTGGESDKREGPRIEIQTLTLNMYNLMRRIYKKLKDEAFRTYRKKELTMLKHVRENFLTKDSLKDGALDDTIRPNIFLAYYSYPSLLTRPEWTRAFKTAIKKLWLEWGGFSTIDKESYLFRDEYTGADDQSYHRGDSWFFINNIAAISMFRLNHNLFSFYIKKIINSSTNEILRSGVLGCPAEVSSAKELRSEGSPIQAWSASTYIEMIDEMF